MTAADALPLGWGIGAVVLGISFMVASFLMSGPNASTWPPPFVMHPVACDCPREASEQAQGAVDWHGRAVRTSMEPMRHAPGPQLRSAPGSAPGRIMQKYDEYGGADAASWTILLSTPALLHGGSLAVIPPPARYNIVPEPDETGNHAIDQRLHLMNHGGSVAPGSDQRLAHAGSALD